ncbi:MAG: hypothetical protein P8R42_06050 [Candidatus Binatia bacterium]|nr:hypothetical protein [Candidatus Binatia bacterium]
MLLRFSATFLSLLLFASTSWAIDLTYDQRRCQAEVGRQGRTFFKNVTKALRKCETKISKGRLGAGTDCTLEPKAAATIAKSAQKLSEKLANRCDDPLVASLGFGGDCLGASTLADLTTCLTDSHQDRALELIDTVFATTGMVPQSGQRKCQLNTAKEAEKVAFRRQDLLRRCKDDIAKRNLPSATDCEDETEGQLNLTRMKSDQRTQASCTPGQVLGLDWGGACEGVTASASLAACAIGLHEQGADALIIAEYGNLNGGEDAALALISDPADCIEGPLSRCLVGDYILSNGKIRVVVQAPGRNLLAVGEYGGNIIDADLVRTGLDPDRDQFEELTTSLNFENGAHYTDLTIINDGSDGQAAVLRATGVDDLLTFANPSSTVNDFGFPFPSAADDTDLPVEIVTDYVLQPGENYVRVDTTITNTGGTGLDLFLGAYIAPSGEIETFQPGYGLGEPLVGSSCPASAPNPCNLMAFRGFGGGDGVSYGYVHNIPGSSSFATAGVAVPLLGGETILALIGAIGPNYSLAASGSPGDAVTLNQHFVVGDGTVSSILEARNEIQFLPSGTISGTATVAGVPTAGVKIVALGSVAEGPALGALDKNVVNHTISDATGQYSMAVAPGSYAVAAEYEGHPYEGGGPAPMEHAVLVVAYATVSQNVAIPAGGTLDVTITDETSSPIAARVTVVGFDSSKDPLNTQNILGQVNNVTGIFRDPGQDTTYPHGVAVVHFVDQTGLSGPLTVEPGDYRVYVSHGTEYSIGSADVTITGGATTSVALQIANVIDTTGFVSGDFHVHSIDSPDSKVPREDRIVSMLAEGADFFVPTDHESVQDFSADIAALGASSLIGTAPGSEITTFDYGHFNAWPLTRDPSQPNGGGIDHGGAAPAGMHFPEYGNYNLTPAEIVAAAHADPGVDTVQVNHIYSYFSLGGSGLAIDTGMEPPQSNVPGTVRRLDPTITNYFTDTFDALEVLIESGRGQIFGNFYGRNLGDWFNMINQGIVKTAIADSDTHRVVRTLAAIPRTFIASPTDDPAALSAIAETLSGNINDGRAIGTNTPMMRVTSSATSTGEMGGLELGLPLEIETTDGAVDITVAVQSPIWAEFDTIEFYVNPVTTRTVTQVNSGDALVDPVDVAAYGVAPDFIHTAGTDFAISTVVVDGSIPGASRLEATTTLSLAGLTGDVWVVAIVRGTDGVSRPLFPVVPFDLNVGSNVTLLDLLDGNLGEEGVPALAYSNPLFVDGDGGGWTAPGIMVTP